MRRSFVALHHRAGDGPLPAPHAQITDIIIRTIINGKGSVMKKLFFYIMMILCFTPLAGHGQGWNG